ncbi:MAG: hypothetical protein K0U98_18185 [Deltaproteobacteria bacterium]|nr:hypothetical protein [Deltaproteobacteria bacterium]
MSSTPILSLLVAASVAALATTLGTIPLSFDLKAKRRALSAAYSVAAGIMIGAGYLLTLAGLESRPSACILGAVLGSTYSFWLRRVTGSKKFDDNDLESIPVEPKEVDRFLLQSSFHSAAEGAAIGAAAAVALPLGLFLAAALAVHNIGEGMVLTHRLYSPQATSSHPNAVPAPLLWPTSLPPAALVVVTKLPQIVLAMGTYFLIQVWPEFLPLALGFTAGALFFLTLTDLTPFAYGQGRREWVALLCSAAAALVVLGQSFFL